MAAQRRLEARHGPDRRGKYQVLVGMVYLVGTGPEPVVDMTLPNGLGTRHAPAFWYIAAESAAEALESYALGQITWGILFWVALMAGGDDPAVIARWRELVSQLESKKVREDLVGIALVFAELAGRLLVWRDALKEGKMMESQVVREWTEEACHQREVKTMRKVLILTIKRRFPDPIPAEVATLIDQQDSVEVLTDWFDAALNAQTFQDFIAVLRR